MAVFQLPTDSIADGAITTAKINASVSLGASVNVILDGTDGGGSNAGDNLILEVFEKGYKYRDKVIRHAKVIVNKK